MGMGIGGPSAEEWGLYYAEQEEIAVNKRREKKSMKQGRAIPIENAVFVETAKVAFRFRSNLQMMQAHRIIKSYKIVWEDKEDALVRVFFRQWKPDDDYDTQQAEYRILGEMAKSDVIFVTKESLRKFSSKNEI